jgi:deoxycytidylate deaminase
MDGKRILSAGWNYDEVHAEINAIGSLKHFRKGLTILSIRVMRSGKLGMARPCNDCMEIIRANHFRWILYTNENGEIIKERA